MKKGVNFLKLVIKKLEQQEDNYDSPLGLSEMHVRLNDLDSAIFDLSRNQGLHRINLANLIVAAAQLADLIEENRLREIIKKQTPNEEEKSKG